jgi:hypothetical protein
VVVLVELDPSLPAEVVVLVEVDTLLLLLSSN